jgi:hypothetical protein
MMMRRFLQIYGCLARGWQLQHNILLFKQKRKNEFNHTEEQHYIQTGSGLTTRNLMNSRDCEPDKRGGENDSGQPHKYGSEDPLDTTEATQNRDT